MKDLFVPAGNVYVFSGGILPECDIFAATSIGRTPEEAKQRLILKLKSEEWDVYNTNFIVRKLNPVEIFDLSTFNQNI